MTTELALAEEDLPDHLATLTAYEAGFVRNYCANGGKGGKAARGAGYSESCADAQASRLLRKPAVIRAIQEEMVLTFATFVPGAARRMRKLSLNAKSEYVQYEASRDIMDRAGFRAPERIQVGVSVAINVDLS